MHNLHPGPNLLPGCKFAPRVYFWPCERYFKKFAPGCKFAPTFEVEPLFKKGDRSLACNYRPVSLTCVLCKLLEHIVCSNIMAHLDEHRLLSEKQHAFRKWHSCETQLITVIDDWAKILDHQGQVDTFILDFEKAFDTPPPLINFSKQTV